MASGTCPFLDISPKIQLQIRPWKEATWALQTKSSTLSAPITPSQCTLNYIHKSITRNAKSMSLVRITNILFQTTRFVRPTWQITIYHYSWPYFWVLADWSRFERQSKTAFTVENGTGHYVYVRMTFDLSNIFNSGGQYSARRPKQ